MDLSESGGSLFTIGPRWHSGNRPFPHDHASERKDALRRRKGRSDELLRALRYERALVYEDLGKPRRARAELEKLYAEDPDDEDVAARLGLQRKSASTPLRAETLEAAPGAI